MLYGLILDERVRNGLSARRSYLIVAQHERLESRVSVEELADGAASAIRDDVVAEVELDKCRMVDDLADEEADLLVVELAPRDVQRAERVTLRHALGEHLAVLLGHVEQLPLEVHAAVAHAVGHAQLLEVRQVRYERAEVEVVAVVLLLDLLLLLVVVVLVQIELLLLQLDGRQQLLHVESHHVHGAESHDLVQVVHVRLVGHERLDGRLELTLEVHALPAHAVLGHVGDAVLGLAAALPVALVADEIGRELERQRGGYLLEHLLAIGERQLVMTRMCVKVSDNGARAQLAEQRHDHQAPVGIFGNDATHLARIGRTVLVEGLVELGHWLAHLAVCFMLFFVVVYLALALALFVRFFSLPYTC